MSDTKTNVGTSHPLTGRQAALADIAERMRRNPNWMAGADPTFGGPEQSLLVRMTDADFDAFQAQWEEERRWLRSDAQTVRPQAVRQEEATPRPQPQPPPAVRAALPFGRRIRELRQALRWTQREVAAQLGVSARSIMRYEQGRSSPLQAGPLLALRRLESAHAPELDSVDDFKTMGAAGYRHRTLE